MLLRESYNLFYFFDVMTTVTPLGFKWQEESYARSTMAACYWTEC